MEPVDDRPVWSIVRFFVDAHERGRGASSALLRAAVDYARSQGATLLEGYPVDSRAGSYPEWFGTRSTFDRAGFKEVARRTKTRLVMRRRLMRRK
jgi:GNAT superfamily N-acetyltransferase